MHQLSRTLHLFPLPAQSIINKQRDKQMKYVENLLRISYLKGKCADSLLLLLLFVLLADCSNCVNLFSMCVFCVCATPTSF